MVEKSEIDLMIETGEEEGHLDTQAIRVAQEQLQTILTVRERIVLEGGVSRLQAQTLKTISTGLESMESHFQQFPVLSYSQLPSKTNLKVTQEGIGSVIWETIKRIAKAILNAIVKGWNFISSLAKKIYGLFFRSQKAAKVTEQKVKAVSDVYSMVFNALSEDAQARLTSQVLTFQLSMNKKLSDRWTEMLQDMGTKGASKEGVIKVWSSVPAKLIADSSVFVNVSNSLEKAISDNGVQGLVSETKSVEEKVAQWDNDPDAIQTGNLLSRKEAGVTASMRYSTLNSTMSEMANSKADLKDFPVEMINGMARTISEIMNGSEGKAYGAMLFEVSKNSGAFQSLEKRYTSLLNSLTTPDESVNNEALVGLKMMMDGIQNGFKACSIINQQMNDYLTLVNDYNDGLLKIYVAAAKEGGLTPEQRKDVQKRLGDLLKIY